MKLREYLPSKDFDNIKSWIDDKRTHAMWCAGRFEYPLEKENFEAVLEDMHSKWGDTPFIASLDDGNNVGFFCYSLNDETKLFLKKIFIVLENADIYKLMDLSHEDPEWIAKHGFYNKQEQIMDTAARLDEYKDQYADIIRLMDGMTV